MYFILILVVQIVCVTVGDYASLPPQGMYSTIDQPQIRRVTLEFQ